MDKAETVSSAVTGLLESQDIFHPTDYIAILLYFTWDLLHTSLATHHSRFEMESERNLPSSPCYFVEEHCIKLPEKKRVCRSASSGKPVRSPCHLQVITEAEEENEEEANEAQPEKTNI